MSAAPNPNFIKGALRLPADILNRRRAGVTHASRRAVPLSAQTSKAPRSAVLIVPEPDSEHHTPAASAVEAVPPQSEPMTEPFVAKAVGRDYVPPTPPPAAVSAATQKLPQKPRWRGSEPKVRQAAGAVAPAAAGSASAGKRSIFAPSAIFPKRRFGRNLWLWVWLAVAIGAAQILLFVNPAFGVYVNAAALLSMLWVAIRNERARQLTIAASIIPLMMLVGMSLPAESVFERSVTVAVVGLLIGLVYQFLFTIDYPREGTRMHMTKYGYALGIPFAFVIGQIIGLVALALLGHQYEFKGVPVALVMMGMVIIAISEEVIFRGLIQQRAMILFHPLMGALLSALLSALLTLGHGFGASGVVIGVLIGLATSFLYYKQQNIILTITLNVAAKLTYVGLVVAFVLH